VRMSAERFGIKKHVPFDQTIEEEDTKEKEIPSVEVVEFIRSTEVLALLRDFFPHDLCSLIFSYCQPRLAIVFPLECPHLEIFAIVLRFLQAFPIYKQSLSQQRELIKFYAIAYCPDLIDTRDFEKMCAQIPNLVVKFVGKDRKEYKTSDGTSLSENNEEETSSESRYGTLVSTVSRWFQETASSFEYLLWMTHEETLKSWKDNYLLEFTDDEYDAFNIQFYSQGYSSYIRKRTRLVRTYDLATSNLLEWDWREFHNDPDQSPLPPICRNKSNPKIKELDISDFAIVKVKW